MSGICLKTARKVAGNGWGARETRSPATGSSGAEWGACGAAPSSPPVHWQKLTMREALHDTLTGVCATLSLIEVRAPHSGLQGAFLSLTRSIVRPNDRIQQIEMKWVCLGLSG